MARIRERRFGMQRTGEKKHRKDKDKNTGGKKKKERKIKIAIHAL